MNLYDLYNNKLAYFRETHIMDNYAKLLALLLLPEKDNLTPLRCNTSIFYNKYKDLINEKIKKIEIDYNIKDIDYKNYLLNKGVELNDLEHDKIWHIYVEGFGALQWALMYYNDKSPEKIYEYCFDEEINERLLRRK